MNEFRPLSNSIFPPVVKNLMIINGILFLATNIFKSSFGVDLTDYLGLYYFESEKFKVWQLFTHLFMHGNLGHIFSNMLSLWMFGAVLENLLGQKKFLTYYLLSGFGAAVIHSSIQFFELHPLIEFAKDYSSLPTPNKFNEFITSFAPDRVASQLTYFLGSWQVHPTDKAYIAESVKIVNTVSAAQTDIVTVGASGAVFALLFAFGYLFPNALIYVYFALPIKAKYFVVLYGVFEFFSGMANQDNVAHYAHLGGMLFGFILLKYWKTRRPFNFY